MEVAKRVAPWDTAKKVNFQPTRVSGTTFTKELVPEHSDPWFKEPSALGHSTILVCSYKTVAASGPIIANRRSAQNTILELQIRNNAEAARKLENSPDIHLPAFQLAAFWGMSRGIGFHGAGSSGHNSNQK